MPNSLLRKSMFFLLAAGGIHIMLYAGFMQWVKQYSQLFKAEKTLTKNDQPYDYLFLGNSHVARGIDTSIVAASFNYGFYGENVSRSYYKLKNLLEKTPAGRFKYIVLPTEISTYTAFMYRFNKYNYYYKKIINQREWLRISQDYEYQINYLLDCTFPYTHFKEVLTAESPKSKKKQKQFMAIDQKSEAENTKNGYYEASTLLGNGQPNDICHPVLMAYLEKTLALCRQNNLKVVFIKYPLSQYFLDASQQIIGNTPLDALASTQFIKRNSDVVVLDYESVFADCSAYFFDSHHLNQAGGEALSILVNHDLSILRKRGKL